MQEGAEIEQCLDRSTLMVQLNSSRPAWSQRPPMLCEILLLRQWHVKKTTDLAAFAELTRMFNAVLAADIDRRQQTIYRKVLDHLVDSAETADDIEVGPNLIVPVVRGAGDGCTLDTSNSPSQHAAALFRQ